ncbi:MAG: histidine kinase [Bacillus sp. (in: firmicutes)]
MNERVRLETAWLQSQIQPHFFFNTLNTIVALSEMKVEKMSILMNEFGIYLRVSFDTRNLEKVTLLDKELELVRSYLYIEQQRFRD